LEARGQSLRVIHSIELNLNPLGASRGHAARFTCPTGPRARLFPFCSAEEGRPN
jgi:hypothetical protein